MPEHAKPPTESAVLDLVRGIEAFGRAQREIGTHLARETGQSRASIVILRYLHLSGPVQVGCIAQHLRVDLSVASRQISTLVTGGLVRRTVDDGDRRARSVELTSEGRTAVKEIGVQMIDHLQKVFDTWDPERLRTAAQHLTEVAGAVEQFQPQNPLKDTDA